MGFLDRLIQIQKQNGYTDFQMAQLIGCSRQLYQKTRAGKMQPSTIILSGAVRAFPKLIRDAHIFLLGDAYKLTGASILTQSPQTHRNGKLRRFISWLRELLRRNKTLDRKSPVIKN